MTNSIQNGSILSNQRNLIHSFSRPKPNEAKDALAERLFEILGLIREIGLILAPELIEWDLSKIGLGNGVLAILQQRICFTDLTPADLPRHAETFGPLAIAYEIEGLRNAGAMPVMYVPQALDSSVSGLASFCVNGALHTKKILEQLQNLQDLSDPEIAALRLNEPVDQNYTLNLQNVNPQGQVVASYSIPAEHAQQVLRFIGFNNIPFRHSIGILDVLLNLFCPTDNLHCNELLGYYQQREWRLISSNVHFEGRPMVRVLSASEKEMVLRTNVKFWSHTLTVEKRELRRIDLAVVYEPFQGWNALSNAHCIYTPKAYEDKVRDIVEDRCLVIDY
jgi:hypothetical protein